MQRNLRLLSIFNRILFDDHANLLPVAAHGFETIRGYAGTAASPIVTPFRDVLANRRDESKRSLLVQVQSEQSCDDLYDYCSDFGEVRTMYHYYTSKNVHYVLVELGSEASAQEVLRNVSHLDAEKALPVLSPFLWFKVSSKKKSQKRTKKFSDKIHRGTLLTVEPKQSLLQSLGSEISMSRQITSLLEKTEIDELGTRLRFLTARQIEMGLSGLFGNLHACPFGSSVNGFGRSGCDLDCVLVFPENELPDSRLVFHAKACSADDRLQVQNHIEVIGDVMHCFMPGCVGVKKITQARVPIIKFRQELTHLDCDVSLYNTSCLQMSEVLYLLGSLDNRVRELVVAVRAWAKEIGLTSSTPGRWISNFSLTLLVIFFLQSQKVLPPLKRLRYHCYLMTAADFNKYLSELTSQMVPNEAKAEELLLKFFQFYASFDFNAYGINLLSGKNVIKPDYSAMFLVNPVAPELNVSKNVSGEETERLRAEMRNAAWMLETNSHCNPLNGESWGLVKLLEGNAHSQAISQAFSRDTGHVTIGEVSKVVVQPKRPELVPIKYLSMGTLSQNTLRHLRWMLQKDKLGQDMFLIGPPGPTRRRLAMTFLEMTGKEVEFIALSRDTTESDLKQRREIVGGTAKYFHQSAVQAAIEGRVLVLEGIEKAERNVLPVLNNLLENREMHLEDGRFLIPASRYDNLLKEFSQEQLEMWNLIRVSENFRVIALGLPVPKYTGNPLDPPLRSRFQARNVSPPSYQETLEALRVAAPNSDPVALNRLMSAAYGLASPESSSVGLPDFPLDNLILLAPLLNQCQGLSSYDLLTRLYPYTTLLGREGQDAVKGLLETFDVVHKTEESNFVERVDGLGMDASAVISVGGKSYALKVAAGTYSQEPANDYVKTTEQEAVVADLMASSTIGDICLLGPRGCGKTTVASRLAQLLSLELEPIVLYQDMSSRDLIQQRTTLPNGDTVWQNSPLVDAAIAGKLLVLEGIDRVHPSTLAVLHRLVQDRELQLFNGRRLLRHDRFDALAEKSGLDTEQMAEKGIFRVDPAFRILALADSSHQQSSSVTKWLTGEMLSLFIFHEMSPMSQEAERHIIKAVCGGSNEKIEQVLRLAAAIRCSSDPVLSNLSPSFSTRQLLRIAKRLSTFPDDSVFDCVQKACLARFLPKLARDSLHKLLEQEGISEIETQDTSDISCTVTEDDVRIGQTQVPRFKTESKSKVPDILFYDVPQHLSALEWLLQDFTLGEHLLLVGNQGVGKNKLADRLLQLLNRPREYIQLHRDTTVQTLTLQPTVRDGVVAYEDSPLVRAVKEGHVLVVDEADKAPTHVTCILKTLVERGEMNLSDGRKILPGHDPRSKTVPNVIPMHPNFRVIVLANRPGFPFLGNDFFAALGDLFSCHAVDNPSPDSEIALLKQYGPDVPEPVILKLVEAFGELRKMADKGLVQYPYSTREVVNIVRHLQMYPEEGLSSVVKNVFDFDHYQKSALETLIPVLEKHGIPINASTKDVFLAKEIPLPTLVKFATWDFGRQIEIEPPEIKPIKMSNLQQLKQTSVLVDRVEARSSSFTELQSYWMLPLPHTGLVHRMAVTKGDSPSLDRIHVLTINPLRLYTLAPGAATAQMYQLESHVPRLSYGVRPRFSLHVMTEPFKGCLALLEENTNFMAIMDPSQGTIIGIDATTTAEKVTSKLGLGGILPKMRAVQANPSSKIVRFHQRGGRFEIIDMKNGTWSNFEFPIKMFAVHAVSDDSWLIQDNTSRKYVLEKASPEDSLPTLVYPLEEKTLMNDYKIGAITASSELDLDSKFLSSIVGENLTAPNRVIMGSSCYAATAVGFPELKHSINDVYVWPRPPNPAHQQAGSVVLANSGQVVNIVSKMSAPDGLRGKAGVVGFLELLDLNRRTARYIPIHERTDMMSYYLDNELGIHIGERSDEGLVVVDRLGTIRLYETANMQLQRSLDQWMKMIGAESKELRLTIERDSGKDVSGPKHGKVDEKNEPHVGGNTWAGGTGGRDTAGLGGKGGPYRLDGGHNVHQISDAEKDDVPEDVKRAAREMGRRAFIQRLKEIQMSEYDHDMYMEYSSPVQKQVQALRVILDSVQAKAKERAWTRHQTSGDLDDLKLIEGLTGERTIYRRRAEKDPEPGSPQMKPKRLRLVVDVSGSMYRFNGYDRRLERMMEATVLVMEAFHGHESKFVYDIIGHSGETHDHVFVEPAKPPTDNKQRLEVIKTMHAHSQFCLSGDHTLPATVHAIETLSQEDCDEAIVVVLSDANLQRYGISPERFGQALTSNQNVGAYAIFIGSLGDEAQRLTTVLPAGRAFVCMDLSEIPQILQQIFTSSVLR